MPPRGGDIWHLCMFPTFAAMTGSTPPVASRACAPGSHGNAAICEMVLDRFPPGAGHRQWSELPSGCFQCPSSLLFPQLRLSHFNLFSEFHFNKYVFFVFLEFLFDLFANLLVFFLIGSYGFEVFFYIYHHFLCASFIVSDCSFIRSS